VLYTILDKGKDKFAVELGKIVVRTFAATLTANVTKRMVDQHYKKKEEGYGTKTDKDEKEKEDVAKKED